MKTSVIVVVVVTLLSVVAFSASEAYRLYAAGSEMLNPRPARWQTRMHTRGWLGGNPNGMHTSFAENDPDYFPKLFNLLDKVGRR